MKKSISFTIVLLITSLISSFCLAQSGYIRTAAGNGIYGFSGDGGPALNAQIAQPHSVAYASGNFYISDGGNRKIRKISPSGIISTIAGDGTTFSGDGGPATAAGLGWGLFGIAADNAGNVYICVDGTRIRKINSGGIISTIAGNGTYANTGDGGPATSASIATLSIAADNAGNVYLSTGNAIRKVSTTGIITTVVGTGLYGFSGDGGPASAAQLHNAKGLAFDNLNNLYIADSGNGRIRMVNPSGIISTVAGNGKLLIGGHNGDGGMALSSVIYGPSGVSVDPLGNIYIFESGARIRRINNHGIITTLAGTGTFGYTGDNGPSQNAKIEQVSYSNAIAASKQNLFLVDEYNNRVRAIELKQQVYSDNFGIDFTSECNGLKLYFEINTYSPGLSIKSFYGDGGYDSTPVLSTGPTGYANLAHTYLSSGTYGTKHYLINAGTIVDSLTYSYNYSMCNAFPIKFYYDLDGNCLYNSVSDRMCSVPITTEISKNGNPIDTVSVTSGINHIAYGSPGDIFSYRVLSPPPNLPIICPVTAISDTIQVGVNSAVNKYVGFTCSSLTNTDMAVSAVIPVTGIHDQWGNIYIRNTSCITTSGTVTINFSPKYVFGVGNARPPATSVSGNTATWDIAGLSAGNSEPIDLYYVLWSNPATGDLTPKDTVQTNISVSPLTGDVNPSNNSCIIFDTVSGSCDPNEIWVSPHGYIPSGTQLKYTIAFENTGNDTAFNIYVMDTLSDFVDPSSLRILSSSHIMNITKVYDNICHNIVRFDFPNINLLDSTHHGQCDGMLQFTINTRNGLADGSEIFNQAGIYFDNNPVVMTNTVEDIIGINTKVAVNNNHKTITGPDVSIYPNPTTDELTIKMGKDAYSSYTITNNLGQVLLQQQISNTQTQLSVKNLPSGLYYITLKGDNGSTVKKFVTL